MSTSLLGPTADGGVIACYKKLPPNLLQKMMTVQQSIC